MNTEKYKQKIGFIGAGKMAEALIKGLITSQLIKVESIIASDIDPRRMDLIEKETGITIFSNNQQVVKNTEIVIIAVKPQQINEILCELKEILSPSHLVISIVAGISTIHIEDKLSSQIKVIRVMPNTPCLIGAGISAICAGKYAGEVGLNTAESIFNTVGKTVRIKEALMDAATALSGCGPAYIFTIIEALTASGVELGLPYEIAHELVLQTVEGSAKMVAKTHQHPALLRDKVTSPGGLTAAGLHVLEEKCLRGALLSAVTAAYQRGKVISAIGNQ